MKMRTLLPIIICLLTITSGCEDTEIDANPGSGFITYEGNSYSLNLLTMISYPTDNMYTHNAVITNKENENIVFSFSIKDNHPENKINQGNYNITVNGAYTARFSIESTGDSLSGTLNITVYKDSYIFNFEGTTVDENSTPKKIVFMYTGKVSD